MLTPLLADMAALLKVLDRMGLYGLKARIDAFLVKSGPELFTNCLAAAAIFYFGKMAAKMAERVLWGVLSRAEIDETLARFVCRMTYAFVLCAAALASLDRVGVNTTSLTAVLAAAGLAIGMALQGSLSNFAAGVLIILFRPFKVGDSIEAAGTKGIVEEINVFSTMLRTPDNVEIVVPNSAITSGNITNYSSKPTRRVDMIVGCGYNDNLQAVKQFLEGVVRSDPQVLQDPAPVVAVHELADHSVNFVVRPWVRNCDYWDVRWRLTEKIKLGFDEHGFTIPFPQRDVHVYTMGEPEAPAAPNASPAAGKISMPSLVGQIFRSEDDGLQRPRRAA